MGNTPVYVWNRVPSADIKDGLTRSEQSDSAGSIEERRSELRRLQDQQSYFLERITDSRVLIIEGISGSGKDTFQEYLKRKLEHRVVYDYSEGEVLHSWKQLQIKGISKLRVQFMNLFVNYIRDVLSRDENGVFLLNRFHLSTYVFTIVQQPELEKEYDEIINVLKTLPVHIFILQLDKNDIDKRSAHPERSGPWRQFQQQIAEKEGFRGRLERYVWQQRLMLERAKRQQIPYSVIKLNYEPAIRGGDVRIFEAPNIARRGVRMNPGDTKPSRKKRRVPETV
jgi:thymidylate kinase